MNTIGLGTLIHRAKSEKDPTEIQYARLGLSIAFTDIVGKLGQGCLIKNVTELSPAKLKLLTVLAAFMPNPKAYLLHGTLAAPLYRRPGLGCDKSACAALLMMITSHKATTCPSAYRPQGYMSSLLAMAGAANYAPFARQWGQAASLADAYTVYCMRPQAEHPEALLRKIDLREDAHAVQYFERLIN